MDSAKVYWLRYFPLEEMPNVASTIAESYRNNLITESEAISGMRMVEKEIENWVKENNFLNKKTKKNSTKEKK
jgi:hypothetical protein